MNPSPYMFFLRLGEHAVVGSSPEVLVRLEGDRVEVRPIAGTRPRGATPEEDRALEAELLRDEKERAEHVMLVDLGRNDVGRVAEFGSVQTTEFMTVERYSHVMHLVSHVDGPAARRALGRSTSCAPAFPAGTVSGAPKIRAMEIIDELEPHRRGALRGRGRLLRLARQRRPVHRHPHAGLPRRPGAPAESGAGIVADSDPAREYEETLNKGRALLEALERAERGLEFVP